MSKTPLILTVSEQRAYRLQKLLEDNGIKVRSAIAARPENKSPRASVVGFGWAIQFTEGEKPKASAPDMGLNHLTELIGYTNLACVEFPDPVADFRPRSHGVSGLKRLRFSDRQLDILGGLGFEVKEDKTAKVEAGLTSPSGVCRIYLTRPKMGGFLVRVMKSGRMLASCVMESFEEAIYIMGQARQEANTHPRQPCFDFINDSECFYALTSDQKRGAIS